MNNLRFVKIIVETVEFNDGKKKYRVFAEDNEGRTWCRVAVEDGKLMPGYTPQLANDKNEEIRLVKKAVNTERKRIERANGNLVKKTTLETIPL